MNLKTIRSKFAALVRTIFDEASQPEDRLRSFSQALIVLSIAVFILFGCGQIVRQAVTQGSIQRVADSAWSFQNIRSLAQGFFEDIFRDKSGTNTDARRSAGIEATHPEPALSLPSESQSSATPRTDPTPSATVLPATNPPPTPNSTLPPTAMETPSATLTLPTATAGSTATSSATQSIDFAALWLSGERVSSLFRLAGVKPNGSGAQASDNVIFAIGEIQAGISFLPGSATIHFYAANASAAEASILFELRAGSEPIVALGEGAIIIPGNTPNPVLFSITLPTIAYTYATQGEFILRIGLSAPLSIHWDGVWNDARIILPPLSP